MARLYNYRREFTMLKVPMTRLLIQMFMVALYRKFETT